MLDLRLLKEHPVPWRVGVYDVQKPTGWVKETWIYDANDTPIVSIKPACVVDVAQAMVDAVNLSARVLPAHQMDIALRANQTDSVESRGSK